MPLIDTADQRDLRTVVQDLLDNRAPQSRLRAFVDGQDGIGGRDELWSWLRRTELTGTGLPAERGGSGAGHAELGILMEEMGRRIVPSPFLASVALAGGTLAQLGDDSGAEDLLSGIASGSVLAAFAPASVPGTVGRTVYDGHGLTGSAPVVVDGALAEVFLVEAVDTQGRIGYHIVEAGAPGLTHTPLVSVDPTRAVARVDLDATPSRPLHAPDSAAARDRVEAHAAFVLAAEQLGGLLHCLEATVEYATVRIQFGRTIGSYQAVKHRLADMYTTGELALSLVREAGRAADEETAVFPVAAHAAHAFVTRAFVDLARESIQLHGGIGFTWEHDLHLHYKRAHASRNLLGGPARHEERVAELLLGI